MNKSTHKLSYFLKRFLILIPSIVLFLFFIHYSNSIKFYGDFTIEFSSINKDTNNIDSYAYDVYGISYFNDTFPLVEIKNYYQSDSSQFFKKLGARTKYVQNQKIIATYNNETLNIKAIDTISDYKDNLFAGCKAPNLFQKVKTIKVLLLFFVFVLVIFFCSVIFVFKYEAIRSRLNSNPKVKKYIIVIGIIFILILGLLIFNKVFKIDKYHNFNLSDTKIEYDSIGINLPNDLSKHTIRIQDTTGNGLNFNFQLNDKFWFTENELLNYIKTIPVTDSFNTSKDIIQAFQFVSKFTYHWYPDSLFYKNNTLNNTYILLNSTGFGICGNSSTTLSHILNQLGYYVKGINIKDYHSFIEVYDGNKWVLLDPDYGLLFLDEKGQAVSHNYIKRQNTLQPIAYKNNIIKNLNNTINLYPEALKTVYCNDSLYSFSTYNNFNFKGHNFILPANTSITFPKYSNKYKTYLLEIVIPGNCSGYVQVPLLVASIKNNEYSNTNFLSMQAKLTNKFYVHGKNIKISAFINPLIFISEETIENTFKLNFEKNKMPSIELIYSPDSLDIFPKLNKLLLKIDKQKNKYLCKSKEYLKQFNGQITKIEDLEKVFKAHSNNKHKQKSEQQLIDLLQKSPDINQNFATWINQIENIALILIFLDNFDNQLIIDYYLNRKLK